MAVLTAGAEAGAAAVAGAALAGLADAVATLDTYALPGKDGSGGFALSIPL